MRHLVTALVMMLLAGRASADPEVVPLTRIEGPFANAFEDRCKTIEGAHCPRIASAQVAPFQRVEFHGADGQGYLAIEYGGQWFIGLPIRTHGLSDPTTNQSTAITFVRLTSEAIPELGTVAVLRLGVHITVVSHCSHHSLGCKLGTPDYRGITEEYDDDVFMVCGLVDHGPRCSRPIVVPEELVRRPVFTSGALVLSAACARFDWRAHGRSYGGGSPEPCRYELTAP
jgi:hypothetical protein